MDKVADIYDVIIIGAGPSGLSCGIAAAQAGLRYLIIEKGVLVNSIYHFPANMTFFSTSKLLEIGDVPFISHVDKPTRREALEYYRRVMQSYDLNVHTYEKVTGVKGQSGDFTLTTTKNEYNAKAIIISTGFYDLPRMLDVPGEDLPKVVHYYNEAHPYVGQKILVIGAANSACDVALETWQKGAEVTMAIRESELYPRVKYWILPNIQNRIKEGSIKAHFNTQVVAIEEDRVVLENEEGRFSIDNDFVLAMTGYQPDFDLLKMFGVTFSDDGLKKPSCDPDTLESNVPMIYLAGVLLGGMQTNKLFIENTRHHGKIIIDDLIGKLSSKK